MSQEEDVIRHIRLRLTSQEFKNSKTLKSVMDVESWDDMFVKLVEDEVKRRDLTNVPIFHETTQK